MRASATSKQWEYRSEQRQKVRRETPRPPTSSPLFCVAATQQATDLTCLLEVRCAIDCETACKRAAQSPACKELRRLSPLALEQENW
jgi:hypothetical protein